MSLRALLLLHCLLLAALALPARPVRGDTARIERVRFVGLTRDQVQQHNLHFLVSPFLGRPATPETIRQALLAVDRTGTVGHGQAELQELQPGRMVLELRFTDKPRRVDQVLFARGDWRPDDDFGRQVEKMLRSRAMDLDTRPGATYHPFLVDLDRERLVELFQQQGYLDVRVLHRARRDAQLVRLLFRIDPGRVVFVKSLRSSGGNLSRDDLLRTVQTQARGDSGLLTTPFLVRSVLEEDVERLAALLRSRGFKDARVRVEETRLDPVNVELEFVIREGRQYRVAEVRVEGAELPPALLAKLHTRSGEPWSADAAQQDAAQIARSLREQGYADAEAFPGASFSAPGAATEAGRAAVTFRVERHGRVRIEKIWFSGNTITTRGTLRKMLTFEEGDLFRTSALEDSKQNMLRSGLFREVAVEVLPGSDLGRRFIFFRVKEAFRLRIETGSPTVTFLNLDLTDVPSGMAELEHGTLFSGGGQSLRMRVSADDLRLELADPYLLQHLTASLALSRTVLKPAGLELPVWSFLPSFGVSLANARFVGRLFWRGDLAQLDAPDALTLPPELAVERGGLTLSSAGLLARVDLTARDDADRFTFSGLSFDARLEGASSWLGSDIDFFGGTLDGTGYLSLHTTGRKQHLVLVTRGRLDWIVPLDDSALPYHRRVWPTPMRGWDSGTLGRQVLVGAVPTAVTIGGEGAYAAELGLRWPLPLGRRNSLMPFVNSGRAFDGHPRFDPTELYHALGLELTFSLFDERLDGSFWLAYPLLGPEQGEPGTSYVGGTLGGAL